MSQKAEKAQLHLATFVGNGSHLPSLVDELAPPDGAFWWLRSRTQARLTAAHPTSERLLEASEGRVFWESGELCWKTLREGLRVVWSGENPSGVSKMTNTSLPLTTAPQERVSPLDHLHVMELESLPSMKDGQILCVKEREYVTRDKGAFGRFVSVESRHPKEWPSDGEQT